ncbi:MAG: type II secretion system protein [Nocardioides sp.]|uniref:type II secretion system F family protein n=1 Tax=Nocardioides sp. TaxID=35761 RepID=UPI0039E31199
MTVTESTVPALSAVCAAGAVWLAMTPRPVRARRLAVRRVILPVVAIAVALSTFASPRALALVAIVAVAVGSAFVLRRRSKSRTAAAEVTDRVREVCGLLGAELGAGRPPGVALELAARAWPPLAPVEETFTLGGSVPDALRRLSALAGAGDLRILAAAWEIAHHTGQGLGVAVAAVAEELRVEASTRRLVAAELASARATARLVACLPVVALVMGGGAGGDPWGFLFGTGAGLVCLAAGLALLLAGLWWIEAIAAGVKRG